MTLDFELVSQVAAARALNTFLEGMALAALSWGALRVFGSRSSVTRFAVWFSTLVVIAALPLLASSGSHGISSSPRVVTLSSGWATGLFTGWAIIAAALLLRLSISLRHVLRLRRDATEIERYAHPGLVDLVRPFTPRRVKLLVSQTVSVPAALGFFRPAVVLPGWALRELSEDELKVVVLHELAHLRRRDDWTNLAQKVVKALFFFHPAVWWIDSRLALEREIACDDLVLEHTPNARAYAASLVSIAEKAVAEKMRHRRALALAQGALGRMKEVSFRVAQILDRRPGKNRGLRPAGAITGALATLALAAMPFAPELVSFQGQAKARPAFSAASPSAGSGAIGSAAAIPASLNWSAAGRATPALEGQSARPWAGHSAQAPSRVRLGAPSVIPAKAAVHARNRKPKVVMARAVPQNQPARTLLVFRSTRVDESGMPVWTLSVWRVTTVDGQTLQEMIVMNSI